jgi:hypothetical protein
VLRIAAIAALVLSCELAAPRPAMAVGINPLDALDDVLGAGANAISGGVAGAAVDGFGAILHALFAVPARLVNRELLAWLVAVPDYAIHPETSGRGLEGSNLAQLAEAQRRWRSPVSAPSAPWRGCAIGRQGWRASAGSVLEGMARTLVAALVIVLWPCLFRHAADLANEAARALLGSGSVLDDTARLLGLVSVHRVGASGCRALRAAMTSSAAARSWAAS